jgi:sRNA-binding protein
VDAPVDAPLDAPPAAPEDASVDGPGEAPPVEHAGAPAASPGGPAGAGDLSPAACARRLAELFPALFAAQPPLPLKLRVQADIQHRAPGVFTKKALSIFLHRHTTSTAYLKALAHAPHRADLDGLPAGDISDEHRQAAVAELAHRRSVHEARREAEREAQRQALREQRKAERAAHREAAAQARAAFEARAADDAARRDRQALLRAWETSTLTQANFCALKGLTPGALEEQLAQARKDRADRPPGRAPSDFGPGFGHPHGGGWGRHDDPPRHGPGPRDAHGPARADRPGRPPQTGRPADARDGRPLGRPTAGPGGHRPGDTTALTPGSQPAPRGPQGPHLAPRGPKGPQQTPGGTKEPQKAQGAQDPQAARGARGPRRPQAAPAAVPAPDVSNPIGPPASAGEPAGPPPDQSSNGSPT